VFGLSPGQAPTATSVFKSNPKMIGKMQNAIFQPLEQTTGIDLTSYSLEDFHFENKDKFPYIINPLAFFEYDESMIYQTAESYGWTKPEDTDSNSTNCLLNGFANEVHVKKHGFHPYAFELAGLIRIGCMTREEALNRLSAESDPDVIDYVNKTLKLKNI
jgi:tRNA(Ile)-lysidine synthase TilS/MesJ